MDPNRFALHLRLHKQETSGIFAVILLHEILEKQGQQVKLVQGYLTVAGETCWHVWIEDSEKNIIDLGRILAEHKDPEFSVCDFKYTIEKPVGTSVTCDEESMVIWGARKDKNFLKAAPKGFLDFRSRIHRRK